MRVLSWFEPFDMWHPNRMAGTCCIGKIHPGTLLVDIVHRTYMLVTYQEVMPDEKDALKLMTNHHSPFQHHHLRDVQKRRKGFI